MNHILYWLTQDPRLLGAETLLHVEIQTRFPGWITLFALIAAVALAITCYRRVPNLTPRQRRVLTTLRACAYALMIFMLANPILKVEGEGCPTGPLPIVVDRTESMSLEDGVAGRSRLKAAQAIASALTEAQAATPSLQQVHYLYGNELIATPPPEKGASLPSSFTAEGLRTSLRAQIEGAFREHRGNYCPGLLLITDGANNVPETLDATLESLVQHQTPVYAVAIGRADAADIALDEILCEDIIFVNEKAKFFINAHQSGFSGQPMPIKATLGNETTVSTNATTDHDGEWSFALEITPHTEGVQELVVEAPPNSREVTTKNNVIKRRVRVIRDRIRVLMIFGQPSWEYRYLCGAFERDRRVQNRVFLQSIDPRIFKGGSPLYLETLPATRDELFRKYDIVCLGRLDVRTLPPGFISLLKDFVMEDGGNLVIHSDGASLPFSAKNTLLEPMLPVRLLSAIGDSSFSQELFKPLDTAYRLELGDEGQGHPLVTFTPNIADNRKTWADFVPVYELATQVELKPSAIPLVNAKADENSPRYPAIAYHNYGRGMVLYMGFDSTWRWRKIYGDRYFRDFWGKVVQFMGLPHLLRESAQARLIPDRLEVALGERVQLTGMIRNRDFSPFLAESIEITSQLEKGEERHLKLEGSPDRPGIFRGSFYPEAEGRWQIRLPAEFEAEPVEITAIKVNSEFINSTMRLPLLNSIAEKTGGAVFVPGALPTGVAPYDAKFTPAARDRATALANDRMVLEKSGKDPFADAGYVKAMATHILKTITDQRSKQPVTVERSLWDWIGLLILAATLFCVEYFFRKIWYLD